jgi:hypothetical protein
MPKASSITAPGKVSNDRESLSSATQNAHFSVRLAKFTQRFSADGGATFESNYTLPKAQILSVAINVVEAYTGATTATVKAGATDISGAMSVASAAVVTGTVTNGEGALTVEFDSPATAGEMVIAVAYIDLSELS